MAGKLITVTDFILFASLLIFVCPFIFIVTRYFGQVEEERVGKEA